MKLLILGASGFVGRSVCSILTTSKGNLEIIEHSGRADCDLREYKSTLDYFATISPDLIINLAAHVGSLKYVTDYAKQVYSENTNMSSNIYSTLSFLEKPTSLINVVANCVYPGRNDILIEKDVYDGDVHQSVFSYGMSRRHLLSLASCYQGRSCINSINFVAPNMFGPGDSNDPVKAHALNAILGKFCRVERETKNKSVEIWGSGKPIREWLFAPDLGRFLVDFISNGENVSKEQLGLLNIAQGKGFSVTEITKEIAKHFDPSIDVNYNLSFPDGAASKILSDSLFRERYPHFKFTNFQTSVANTVAYYKEMNNENRT
jgi:GDP-L-fucose synthase